MKNVDVIVVGQGLAGSVLALKLFEHGYSVMVIDQPELSTCSKVAAGIWNPVVFKRLTKSWLVDELLPELRQFYRNKEHLLNASFVTDRCIIKLFSEQQEADLWKKKAELELRNYLDRTIYYEKIPGIHTSEFGYSKVLNAGNLDVRAFLTLTQHYLKSKESMLAEKFDYRALSLTEIVTYKDIQAKSIVFAEGHLIKNNPYFNYIPFKPAKGEVLTIKSSGLQNDNSIINKNAFIMKYNPDEYKLGATYNWETLNDLPSEKGEEELKEKFGKMSHAAFEILKQEAGVRPSVIDRRPVIGRHPKEENVYVFNGMGTKGVMLAPYFAQKWINYLKFAEPLDKEFNVSRFNHLYTNQ